MPISVSLWTIPSVSVFTFVTDFSTTCKIGWLHFCTHMSSWVSWQYCSWKSYSNLDYAFIRRPIYRMLRYKLFICFQSFTLSNRMDLHFVIICRQSIICAHSCVAGSTFVLLDCPFSCPWCVWWCPDTYWWCPNTLWVLLCTFWVVPKHFLMLLKHTLGPVMHILSGAQTHLGAVQTHFRSS